MSRLLVRDLAQVASPAGREAPLRGEALGAVEVIEDAYVLCVDGCIEAVGKMDDLRALDGDVEEIDGRGRCAVPGLVDCHTHACFAGDRVEEFSLRAGGATYEELHAAGGGILSTVRATRAAGEPALHEAVEPETHAEIEPEIQGIFARALHKAAEPEIHAEIEPEIHAVFAPALHKAVQPEIHAEIQDIAEPESATEDVVPSTPMPFSMRPANAPAFTENVPTVKDDDAESVDDRLVTLLTPNSFAGEQYRTLRHLVEKMHTETGVSVVGVSSPSIGDGKTTTAINLAGALAQARETRVLLIDMDLRRPAVSGQLGLRGFNPKGVVAVLGAGASLDEVIVELPMFNLSIIPSGARQSAPYELLKSSRLHQMIDEARRRFDYVIVDTPPVIAVPDCRVISSALDGFLIIVNAHKTPTRMLGETVSVLGQSKVLGLIFNRDDQPIAEDLYNSYGPDPSSGWTSSLRRRLRRNGRGNGNGNGNGFLSGNGITH